MKINHILAMSTLLTLSNAALAAPFSIYDARSAGMGGTGVASAHISSAPFYNPAMLAAQREKEDFALLFGGGIAAHDNNKLLDDVEAYNNAVDTSNATAYEAAIDNAVGKKLSVQASAFIALGFAGETWSMAASSNGYVQASIGTTKAGTQGIDSTIDFTAIEVTETGFSLARKFGDLSIGITPKVQSITSYDDSALLSNNDDLGDFLDTATTNGKDHDSTSNLDVGLIYKVTENWKIGGVLRNALSEEYTTSQSKKVVLDPQTRAGIAYTGETITFAVDYDLAKNDPIIVGGEETQYLNAGVELDLADFFQLRAGMSSNTANSASEDVYSIGLGFTIVAVQLDIAAVGNDNSVSAYLQLGVRW